MTRAIRLMFAAIALALSGAANATLVADWGSLGPPGTEVFGNTFTKAGDFADEYRFSLAGAADGFGGTLTIDPLSFLDISISSVALWHEGSVVGTDVTPGVFSFSSLLAGSYSLFVNGTVARGAGFDDILPLPVGYLGSITTTATSVPEPGTLALFGLGLMGLGLRRRAAR